MQSLCNARRTQRRNQNALDGWIFALYNSNTCTISCSTNAECTSTRHSTHYMLYAVRSVTHCHEKGSHVTVFLIAAKGESELVVLCMLACFDITTNYEMTVKSLLGVVWFFSSSFTLPLDIHFFSFLHFSCNMINTQTMGISLSLSLSLPAASRVIDNIESRCLFSQPKFRHLYSSFR